MFPGEQKTIIMSAVNLQELFRLIGHCVNFLAEFKGDDLILMTVDNEQRAFYLSDSVYGWIMETGKPFYRQVRVEPFSHLGDGSKGRFQDQRAGGVAYGQPGGHGAAQGAPENDDPVRRQVPLSD